jgi:outer membrane protein assembly factor BamB
MTRWRHLLPLLLAVGAAAHPAQDSLVGVWSGDLREGSSRIPFSVEFKEGHPVSMLLDIPELKFRRLGPYPVKETPTGMKADDFSFRSGPDGESLVGDWSFDGHRVDLVLRRGPLAPSPAPRETEVPVARPVWTVATGGPIWSPPAADEERVYFGSNDGKVYARDVRTGAPLWEFATGKAVVAPPTLAGNYVHVLSDDGGLYKLRKDSGALIWRFETHGGSIPRVFPLPGKDDTYDVFGSGATVAGGLVYVGSADGKVYAVDDRTGKERWHFETHGIVRSTPAVVGGRVYFGSRDHKVYCVDALTGELLWSHDSPREIVSSPLLAGGTVFIGSRSSDLLALDALTGATRWSYFYWSSWVESSARIRNGILYVGSSDYQQLLAIRASSGGKVWAFSTGGSAWATPWVENDRVYIGAVGVLHYFMEHAGGFFAVDRATGKGVWRYPFAPLPGEDLYGVASSPRVSRGLVLFGALDGTFYAFPGSP